MAKSMAFVHTLLLVLATTAPLRAGAPEGAILCIRGEATFTLATGTFGALKDAVVEVEAYLTTSTDRFDFLDDTASFPMTVGSGFTMTSGGEIIFESSSYSLVANVFDTTTVAVSGGDDTPRPVLGILQLQCPVGVVDIKSLTALVEFLQNVPASCGMKLILDERDEFSVLGEAEGPVTFEAAPTCDDEPPPPIVEKEPPAPTAPQEPVIEDGPCAAACSLPCRIYLHSGEEHFERTDLAIPGRGGIHFAMRRSYRSRLDYDGPLGYGWDFSYNESLFIRENGDVLRASGNGHVDEWTRNADGSYTAPSGYFRALVREPDGTFILRSRDGFKRRYDADGGLAAYVDRSGNIMSFEYDERGNLARVIDAYGRVIEFIFSTLADGRDRLAMVRDFIGREAVYTYDERGDLVEVRSPIVTGTSTGNDFPSGKTERYAYSSGHEAAELNHNLLSVTRPEEVALGGPPALTWTYGEDPADPATFDKVVRFGLGGRRKNASDVPAGGDFVLEYESLGEEVPPGDPDVPRGRARVTERNGNVMEYFINERNQHILTRRLTRGIRPGEPEFYETRSFFDADNQLVRRVLPEGNEIRYAYGSGSRFARKNVVEIRRVADSRRGGGEDLVTTFTYEPLYNQVASVTDPRGNAAGFEPPLGEASAERYTTRYFYDYQESDGPIAEAEQWGIDLSGVGRGLGDLNGDGRTDQAFGNLARTMAPPVELRPDSKEAERLGGTTQSIVTEAQWNDRGQLLRVIDPEGNVTLREYYPSSDPDGDGEDVPSPRSSGPAGYLRSQTEDAEESARRLGEVAPTMLTTSYRYDPVGNITGVTNPRGVATEIEVNQLNQAVVVTRGADVTAAAASGELITGEEPLRYEARRFYDHNDRVVRTETENREEVSTTEGVGDSVERTYTYDLLDNLVRRTAEVDAGTTLTWETRYDENELPTLRIEPEGNRHQVTYDERNLPFEITRGLGSDAESTTRIDYDGNRRRSRIIDAEDNDGDGEPEVVALSYDGFDRLTATTDALGNRALTSYDTASNVVRRQVIGHPPGEPGAAGVPLSDVRYLHDELNRTFQVDRALFVSEGFEPARPLELKDENSDGLVTERIEYDRASRVTSAVEDDLERARRVYDGADRVVEVIDAAGNRALTEYDRNSNPTSVTSVEISPEGLVPEERFTTRYSYDQLDRLVRATDNLGQTTRFRYDSRDNLTVRSDPEGDVVADPLGIFPGEINDAGNTKTYFYDGLDRRLRQVCDLRVGGRGGSPLDTANAANPDGQVSLEYVYDGNSRLSAMVDDNGNRTSYAYDALNRRVLHRNADGKTYGYTYDRDDNLVQIVDPNSSTITQRFDTLNRLTGRKIERGPGVTGTTLATYAYDGLSRLVRWTDDNGAAELTCEVETVYDSLSRVWEERQTVPRHGQPQPRDFTRGDANADGAYDLSDAVRGLLVLHGAEAECLDAADSNDDGQLDTSDAVYTLLSIFVGGAEPPAPFGACADDPTEDALGCESYPPCEAGGDGSTVVTGVVSTTWSGDGKRLTRTYPGGRTIESAFDLIDRVKAISDSAGTIAESSWIGPGYRELERLCGNGTRLSFLDDSRTADVGYDGVKRIVRMRGLLPGGTPFLDREYGYNRASRRTFEKRNDDAGLTDRYVYDSLYRLSGTRLDEDGGPNAPRRERAEIDYVLDGVGNRRTVEADGTARDYAVNEMNEYTAVGGAGRAHDDNGSLTDDGEQLYSYDYRNRLNRVARKDTGEVIARYLYHADGRRAVKVAGEAETLFFYDGWQVCEETGGVGSATYVWSPVHVDQLVQMERAGEAFYAHQNARGDVVAVTDSSGAVVDEIVYDDFGRPSSASAVGNPYLFHGRRLDRETGLYYFRNRYYDARAGRFLHRDPVWDPGNVGNQYTFVGNGPVSGRDPMGSYSGGPDGYDQLHQQVWRVRADLQHFYGVLKYMEGQTALPRDKRFIRRVMGDIRGAYLHFYSWGFNPRTPYEWRIFRSESNVDEEQRQQRNRRIYEQRMSELYSGKEPYSGSTWAASPRYASAFFSENLARRQRHEADESTVHFGHFGSAYFGAAPGLARLGMLWSGDDAFRTTLYVQDAKFDSLPTFDARAAAVKRWLLMDKSDSYNFQMGLRKKYGRFSLVPLGPEPDCPGQSEDGYEYAPVDPPTMTPEATPDGDGDSDSAVDDSVGVHVLS